MSKEELLALTVTEPKEACYRMIMIMIMIMIMMMIIIINNEKTEKFVTGLLALTVTEPGRDSRFWLTRRVVISTTRVVISTRRIVIWTTTKNRYRELSVTEPGR
jgi:hypothetical protein